MFFSDLHVTGKFETFNNSLSSSSSLSSSTVCVCGTFIISDEARLFLRVRPAGINDCRPSQSSSLTKRIFVEIE